MNTVALNPKEFDWSSIENGLTHEELTKKYKRSIASAIALHAGNFPSAPTLPLNNPNGTIIQDSFDHYLGAKAHYSTGAFAKLANGDPLDFQWEITEGAKEEMEKFKNKGHFDLGRFLHMAILEPEIWGNVVVEPKANRTKHDDLDMLIKFWVGVCSANRVIIPDQDSIVKPDEKKAYIQKMMAMVPVECIDEKQHLIVQTLHDRWKSYENAVWFNLLAKAHKEVSMYTDNFNGLPMRVRPDGLLFEEQIGVNAIVSVKTTSSPSIRGFRNDCAKYAYDVKEAAYQDIVSHVTGRKFRNTLMIVFQTCEPFHVGVFLWGQGDLEIGRIRFTDAFNEGKALIQSGIYPGWEEEAEVDSFGMIDFSMPEWVKVGAE